MTQELIERLRRKAGQYDSYDWHSATEVEAADALERLTAERDSLQEGLDGWHARYLDCEVEFARLVDVCHAAKLRLATERDALRATCERARGCIAGLLKRTPVRDVAETLAEIDDAIGEKT